MRKAGLAGRQMAHWTGVVGWAEEGKGRGVAAGAGHPGVLVAKVGYFDPKSAKVPIWADGHQKPAKVGHLAAK